MARNTNLTMSSTWTELTNANVTSITIQNQSGAILEVMATTGSAPASEDGRILIPAWSFIENRDLADLFPGVAGADRVFARGYGQAFVSHA